jgi:hypothetical protein
MRQSGLISALRMCADGKGSAGEQQRGEKRDLFGAHRFLWKLRMTHSISLVVAVRQDCGSIRVPTESGVQY